MGKVTYLPRTEVPERQLVLPEVSRYPSLERNSTSSSRLIFFLFTDILVYTFISTLMLDQVDCIGKQPISKLGGCWDDATNHGPPIPVFLPWPPSSVSSPILKLLSSAACGGSFSICPFNVLRQYTNNLIPFRFSYYLSFRFVPRPPLKVRH